MIQKRRLEYYEHVVINSKYDALQLNEGNRRQTSAYYEEKQRENLLQQMVINKNKLLRYESSKSF